MTTYTKETAIYNTEAIQSGINDARDYYVTSVTNDGVWVTPHDAKPVNGQPVSTTRGWHIADALEYFRGTVRYIKAWLNGTTPTVRLGQDTSGHADVTPDGLEVLTDASTSVAQFGADGARIGTVDSDHISLESGNISFVHDADVVFNVETNSSFTRTIDLTPYLTNRPSLQHQNMSSVTDETYTDTKDFVIDQNIESGDVFTVYVEWNIQKASSSWAMDEGECSFTYGTSETKQVFSINETNIVCEGYVVYASPNTLTVRLHVTRQQPTSFILNMSVESAQYDHTFTGPFYRLGKSSANGPGLYAIDHGTDNYTGGTSSMASGENNIVGDYARNSFAVGESNTVHEKNSAVFGTYNSIGNVSYSESPYGNYFMFGEHLQQNGQIYPNLTIGRYNQITSNTELFAIGNGTSSARSNALTVDGNGNVLIAGNVQDMNRTQLYANASHSHSYLPLSGGKMTGRMSFKDSTAMPNASTNTDFFAVGFQAFTNGGGVWYKGAVDFKSWLAPGSLYSKNTNTGFDRDGANPSAALYGEGYTIQDKDGERVGFIRANRLTDGTMQMQFAVANDNTSGTEVTNYLTVGINRSGTRSVSFAESAPWRTALGLDALVKVVSATTNSISIAANSNHAYAPTLTIPSGYTLVGPLGCKYTANNANLSTGAVYKYSDTQIAAVVCNHSSSAKSVAVTTYGLCVKTICVG